MALKQYGVLVGRVVDSRREDEPSSPHFQIRVKAADVDYRIAVNVKSQTSPSELLFIVVEDFDHVVTDRLATLGQGFTAVPKRPGGLALDFIRANLFDRLDMRPLPPNLPGPDNDLSDRLAHFVDRASTEADARIFVFGERWGPESGKADKAFGFKPGNGVHDIHMNQGNVGRFVEDDGVWQDGGLILHFPSTGWIGFDPANRCGIGDNFVKVAVGRDFRDVPPNKGIFRGNAQESITATVHSELLTSVPPELATDRTQQLNVPTFPGKHAPYRDQVILQQEHQQQQ